jgi:CRP/FNR family transcriptional regulator, cyclic AMP receptor protein
MISISTWFRPISLAKLCSDCFELYGDRVQYRAEEENTLKSRTKGEVKTKAAFEERLGRPMLDPTLEGKDESKVGSVQEKTGPVNWEVLLTDIFPGNTVVECRTNRKIFRQGQTADSLYYLRRGKVKLTVTSPQGKAAVVAVLGAGEFFGEGCLAGQRLRIATAIATTDCILDKVDKPVMLRMLHEQQDLSELFVKHLLSRGIRYEADLIDQLFNSSEKRLARILLLLANFGKESRAEKVVPTVSQDTLAHMVGTTRSKVGYFMNKFKGLGFIENNGHGLTVNSSLLNVVLHD